MGGEGAVEMDFQGRKDLGGGSEVIAAGKTESDPSPPFPSCTQGGSLEKGVTQGDSHMQIPATLLAERPTMAKF